MPTTYVQRDTASDLSAPGEYDLQLLETTGTLVDRTITLDPATTAEGYHYTEPGVPGDTGVTGDYTVEVDIAVGDNQVFVSAAVARVNSSGAVQTQSAFSAEQQATGVVQTHTFTAENLGTWASGDRLRVAVRYRNDHAKTARSVDVSFNTVESEVVAPWGATVPTIAVSDSQHGHTSGTPTTSVSYTVAPSDSQHGHTSGAVAVSPGTVTVAVADSQHGHTSDTVTVTASGGGGGTATLVQGDATTTPDATFAATPTAGNLLVLFYGARDGGNNGVPVFTLPAGWTVVGTASPMEFHTFGIAWRVSDGSAIGTQTVSYDRSTSSKWTGMVEFALSGTSDWALDASSFDGSGATNVASIASGTTGTLSDSEGVAVVGGTSRTGSEDLSTDTGTSLAGTDVDFEVDAGSANFIAAWLALASTAALDATISEASGSSRMGAGIAVFVPAGGGAPTVVVSDSQHAHTSETPTTSVSYTTSPADSQHGHTSETVAVSVSVSVAPADSQHPHTSGLVAVAVAYTTAPADSQHGHTSDVATVAVAYTVAPLDSQHGHTSDVVAVSVSGTVSVADSQHAHASDPVTVDVSYTVAPAGSQHGHTSDTVGVSVAGVVAVADSQHAHTSDVPTVSVAYTTAPADSSHAHTSDTVVTTAGTSITVADVTHPHTSGTATVDVTYVTAPADSQHGHTSQLVDVIDPTEEIVVDPGRTGTVVAGNRTGTVSTASRTGVVNAGNRTGDI